MRRIGSISSREHAERFVAFLASEKIKSRVDEDGDHHLVWVYDEDHVERAKEFFEKFCKSPDAELFVEGARRNRHSRQLDEALQRHHERVLRRHVPRNRSIPLTMFLVTGSLLVTLLTQFGKREIPLTRLVMMSSTSQNQIVQDAAEVEIEVTDRGILIRTPNRRGWSAIPEIQRGEIWRIVTPIFLHLGVIHLLFNMSWLVTLGSNIEYLKGTRYMLGLVLFITCVANFAELFASGPYFGGMSGVVYGLFGFIWIRSRLVPEDGFWMEPVYVFLFLAWALICLSGAAGPIANGAHFGGLAAGALVGSLPVILPKHRAGRR